MARETTDPPTPPTAVEQVIENLGVVLTFSGPGTPANDEAVAQAVGLAQRPDVQAAAASGNRDAMFASVAGAEDVCVGAAALGLALHLG